MKKLGPPIYTKSQECQTIVVHDMYERLFDFEGWCEVICILCSRLPLTSAEDIREHYKMHSESMENKDDVIQNDEVVNDNISEPALSEVVTEEEFFEDDISHKNKSPETDVPIKNNKRKRKRQRLHNFQCDDCQISFDQAEKLKHHAETVHNSVRTDFLSIIRSNSTSERLKFSLSAEIGDGSKKRVNLNCQQCDKDFESLLDRANHTLEHHSKVGEESLKSDTFSDEANEDNLEIDSKLNDMEAKWVEKMKHLQYKSSGASIEDRTCKICGKVCWSLDYLMNRHMKICHSNENWVQCEVCGIALRNANARNLHRAKAHREVIRKVKPNRITHLSDTIRAKKYGYELPPKRTEAHKTNKEVKHKSTKEKKFQCTYCNFSTKWKNCFQLHVASQHEAHLEKTKNNMSQCQYCEYRTISKNNMKRHVFVRHEYKRGINTDKAFICHLCSYTTPNSSCYRDHVKHVHEGVPRKKRAPRKKKKQL